MTVTITHSARVPVPITILLSGISKAADLAHTLPHTRRQYLTFPVQGSIWELPKIVLIIRILQSRVQNIWVPYSRKPHYLNLQAFCSILASHEPPGPPT